MPGTAPIDLYCKNLFTPHFQRELLYGVIISLPSRASAACVGSRSVSDKVALRLQRPAQHAGTSASSPITLDTPARPGVKHENQPQETTATIQQPDFQTTDNTQGHMPPQPLLQQAPFRCVHVCCNSLSSSVYILQLLHQASMLAELAFWHVQQLLLIASSS